VRQSHRLVALAACLLLLAGCAAPTMRELATAGRGRAEAAAVLEEFAAAVRLKEPERLRPLLDPELGVLRRRQMELELARSSWLKRYAGFRLDAARALAAPDWRAWQRERLRLKVPASNSAGEGFFERFELVRRGAGWRIADFHLAAPSPGDALDPPEAVREELLRQVRAVLDGLKAGHAGEVYNLLPKGPHSRSRYMKPTFWQKLGFGERSRVSVYNDLRRLTEFSIFQWPDPSVTLPVIYLGLIARGIPGT